MKQFAISLAVALLLQTVPAVKLTQSSKGRFMDDVVQALNEDEHVSAVQCNPCPASAARPNPHYGPGLQPSAPPTIQAGPGDLHTIMDTAALAQCNPCAVSAARPNPHYGPGLQASAPPTIQRGPGDLHTIDHPERPAPNGNTATLAQEECSPCPVSAAAPNPHYGPGTKVAAKPVFQGSGAPPAAEEEKKEETTTAAAALSQVECNPCPASAAAPNTHYGPGTKAAAVPYSVNPLNEQPAVSDGIGGAPAGTTASLVQIECNPCVDSATGLNPHYGNPGQAVSAPPTVQSGPGDLHSLDVAGALSQLECNPCAASATGLNPHYGNPGQAVSAPPTVQAGPGDLHTLDLAQCNPCAIGATGASNNHPNNNWGPGKQVAAPPTIQVGPGDLHTLIDPTALAQHKNPLVDDSIPMDNAAIA